MTIITNTVSHSLMENCEKKNELEIRNQKNFFFVDVTLIDDPGYHLSSIDIRTKDCTKKKEYLFTNLSHFHSRFIQLIH